MQPLSCIADWPILRQQTSLLRDSVRFNEIFEVFPSPVILLTNVVAWRFFLLAIFFAPSTVAFLLRLFESPRGSTIRIPVLPRRKEFFKKKKNCLQSFFVSFLSRAFLLLSFKKVEEVLQLFLERKKVKEIDRETERERDDKQRLIEKQVRKTRKKNSVRAWVSKK